MSENMRLLIWIALVTIDLWIILKAEWNKYSDD